MTAPVVGGTRIAGVLFDCYGTLVDILTDEGDPATYRTLARWLLYQGVLIEPEALRSVYDERVKSALATSPLEHPDIRIEEVFAGICADYRSGDVLPWLGIHAARTFRAASLRHLAPLRESLRLLDAWGDVPFALVSNGQRVFSEPELAATGLAGRFAVVLFSSDIGIQKPNPEIFRRALAGLGIEAGKALFVGDSHENDIVPAEALGMQALHIEDAWSL
jgi:putative hydrolase of the HAD superfamily